MPSSAASPAELAGLGAAAPVFALVTVFAVELFGENFFVADFWILLLLLSLSVFFEEV